ncbi:MAG: TMEM175 family protein [Candidatus Aegiribacteria sp.]|nr:TMEM175 family protein [Candidatus Aegiribacteria sp.]
MLNIFMFAPGGDVLKKASLGKSRIEAISDGIYAIAMTLAVLSIDVDAVLPSHESLIEALPGMIGELRHYIISFLTLASFWIGQHYLMDRIKVTDASLNWIIMLHLLFITLIPITTDVIGDFDSVLAVQIFVVNLFLISVSIDLEYIYVRRHPDLGLDKEIRKHKYLGMVIFPGFSVLVFFLAWPFQEWATLLYVLIPFVRKSIN